MQTHLMIAGTTGPKCLERLQETRMATLPTPALVIQVILLFIFAGSWDRFQNIRSPPAMLIKRQSNPGGPLVWKSPASRSVLVGTVQGGGFDCRFWHCIKIDRTPSFSDLEQKYQLKKYRKIRFYSNILILMH